MTLLPTASFKLRQLLDANKGHPITASLELWITKTLHRKIDEITSLAMDRQEIQQTCYVRYIVKVVFNGNEKLCEALYILE